MHGDTDFARPPRRRIGALGLFRDETGGRVLLVEKAYRTGPDRWGLVGGGVLKGEAPHEALAREAREETGLAVVAGRVLAVHWMPAEGDTADGYNLIFDGGVIPSGVAISLPPEELVSYRFVAREELESLVAPYTRARIEAALDALDGGPAAYLVGHPR